MSLDTMVTTTKRHVIKITPEDIIRMLRDSGVRIPRKSEHRLVVQHEDDGSEHYVLTWTEEDISTESPIPENTG